MVSSKVSATFDYNNKKYILDFDPSTNLLMHLSLAW